MGLRDQLRTAVGDVGRRAMAARQPLAPTDPPTPVAAPAPPAEHQATPQRWTGPRSIPVGRQAAGLTPQRVSALLEQANQGDPRAFCELLEEIEDRDAHQLGVLAVRKRAVANLPWHLEPATDSPRDREIAEWCERVVREIDGLETAFLDLLDAVYKGYAISELTWGVREGRHVLLGIEYRPQRWFKPDPDDPMRWRLLDNADAMDGVPLQADGYVIHTSRARSGWPVQAALGRVLVWLYLFKSYALKDWVAYVEMFGSPLRVGKFPVGSKKPDIDALYTALVQLGVDAAAVIPADMAVEFVVDGGPRTGGDTFEKLLSWVDKAESKAILGQTLTTEEGSSGTQALGTVHNEVRLDIVVADAKQLASSLTRYVLEPLCRWNFGARPPRWVFEAEAPVDEQALAAVQTARAAVFSSALALGVPVALAQVQDELGIRAPTAGDVLLKAPPPPASPFGFRAPMRDQAAGHSCPRCDDTPIAMADRPAGLPSWRVQIDGEVAAYLAPGSTAWRAIVAELRKGLEQGLAPDVALRRAVAGVADFAAAIANATLTAELLAEAQAMANDQVVDVPGAKPLDEVYAEPGTAPVDVRRSWAGLLDLTAQQYEERKAAHQAQATDVARWATLGAAQELAAATDDTSRAAAAAALEGGKKASGPIETGGNIAVNKARQRYMERQASRRPYFRYHSLLLPTTRPSHAAMDGRVYLASDPIWQVWTPPNGWQCYCWITAHTRAEVEAAGWRIWGTLPADEAGAPLLPDAQPKPEFPDWRRDLTREKPEYDWAAFPEDWRQALGMEAA
jgi:phage gp29-like protein